MSRPSPMSWIRAIATVVITVLALLTIALPFGSMRVGLPDGGSEPKGSAVELRVHRDRDRHSVPARTDRCSWSRPSRPDWTTPNCSRRRSMSRTAISDQPDVVAVAPIAVSDDNRLAAFQVLPTGGPNSESTEALVKNLRALPPIGGDIPIGVAGQAAINIDISQNLADVLPLYLLVVVGLSMIIMIIVFRSLLVPVIATGGFILSLFATYGALVAVFQFGLGRDAVRDQRDRPHPELPADHPDRDPVRAGDGLPALPGIGDAGGVRPRRPGAARGHARIPRGRSVVIAAGLIMVAVFGGFIFSESVIIRALGFGLAFGVLADAFVVRLLLMPALMHLLGRSAWWLPRWLNKVVPNVDVEGAALERKHHA